MKIRFLVAALAVIFLLPALAPSASGHSPDIPGDPTLVQAGSDAVTPWLPYGAARTGPAAAAGPGAGISAKRPYRLRGLKWPGRKIKVRIRTRGVSGKVVRAAMKAWNRSGAGIRFIETKRKGGRQILVTTDRRLYGGKASLGFIPRRGVIAYPGPKRDCTVNARMPRRKYIRLVKKRCPWAKVITLKHGGGRVWLYGMPPAEVRENFRGYVRLAAHELGHTLGLHHRDTSCLIMNTRPKAGCTHSRTNPLKTICKVPMPGDVKGAVHRYGGRVKVRKPKRNLCNKFRSPGAPSLSVAAASGNRLSISVKAGYLPPPYKRAGHNGRMTVLISNKASCPYRKGGNTQKALPGSYALDSFLMPWNTRSGQAFSRSVSHPAASFPGSRLCVAAYVGDRYGRLSRLSAPSSVPSG